MSRRSLSLQAYLAYAGGPVVFGGTMPDPPVADLWLHAETIEAGRALARLSERLLAHRPDVAIVATGAVPPAPAVTVLPTPPERRGACEAFARALRAPAGLWAGQSLRPALIDAFERQGTRLSLVEGDSGPWPTPAPRWLPDPAVATLGLFYRIHAIDRTAARALRRAGLEAGRISIGGPLRDAAPPRECDAAEHETAAARIAGRPVWLAARLRADEADPVMRAHRSALRLAHRLLLIAVPQHEAEASHIANTADAHGLRSCDWDAGEMPDENTQVLMTQGPEGLPLWYRLSPLTFLGGSLVPGHGGEDPFEAAALGAALLYGPQVGHHLPAYRALVEAGAARIVRDANSLAGAVTQLVAPDQAATMAHAGWTVVSAGAALVDDLIADIAATLDAAKAPA
jgi:3-deoxy-D-manno-octulosonic-acid transferase